MALQVWLPLTKDLRNQGVADITVTNSGATYSATDGKLGGCYNFTKDSSCIILNGSAINSLFTGTTQPFSIATWVYHGDSTRAILFGDYGLGGMNFNVELTTAHVLRFYWNSSPDYSTVNVGASTWSHIAVTYDGTKICTYLNGVLSHTNTITLAARSKSSGNWQLGKDSRNTDTPLVGKLNDFRLYDTCLTPEQVKRISQGLVLHYPLDRNGWGQENLLSRYVVPGMASPTSTAAGGKTTWLGDYKITIPATENADTYFRLFTTKQLTANATYTISCKVDGLLSGSYYRFPLYAQNNTAMGVLNLDHNGLCSLTFTMTYGTQTAATGANGETVYICFMDDSTRAIASGQGAITLSNFKLEEGSKVTPWSPASTDTLATTLNINGTTEYDTSGFCNNGTRTGTFTWTSDTPKYSVSSIHTGTNYIYLTPPSTEVQTIAIWVKWDIIPSGQSVILVDNGSGIGLGLMSSGILCSTSSTGSSYTFSKASLVANIWYHFVVVKTGTTTRKLYINGVEQTATSNISNWTYSVNQLQLGKRSTTSDGFIGELCDFRVYTTALSADDVKSLYQNCATIDPDGTIRGQIRS